MFRRSVSLFTALSLSMACSLNSVTSAEIEAIQPGNIVTYRFEKGGKRWFYADKITRIEGDMIYFNPSLNQATSGSTPELGKFDTTRELSMSRAEILKYRNEQGPEDKKIIWIE